MRCKSCDRRSQTEVGWRIKCCRNGLDGIHGDTANVRIGARAGAAPPTKDRGARRSRGERDGRSGQVKRRTDAPAVATADRIVLACDRAATSSGQGDAEFYPQNKVRGNRLVRDHGDETGAGSRTCAAPTGKQGVRVRGWGQNDSRSAQVGCRAGTPAVNGAVYTLIRCDRSRAVARLGYG